MLFRLKELYCVWRYTILTLFVLKDLFSSIILWSWGVLQATRYCSCPNFRVLRAPHLPKTDKSVADITISSLWFGIPYSSNVTSQYSMIWLLSRLSTLYPLEWAGYPTNMPSQLTTPWRKLVQIALSENKTLATKHLQLRHFRLTTKSQFIWWRN